MSDRTERPLHENHRARMRERVERDGLESLAEHEALEYLLFLAITRQDTNALAHRLIQHFGSFCNVLEASEEELMQVDGVGAKSAQLITSVLQFSRYYNIKHRKARQPLNDAQRAMQYVKPLFYGQQNEIFYLIMLDDQYRPLKDLRIAEGVPNHLVIDTRRVLREVAKTNSTCTIMAHNHPSGLAVPSAADQMTTRKLADSLSQIGVSVIDHFIVAGEDVTSMRQRGQMPECGLP